MAEFPVEDDQDVILVEFESRSGLRTVSRGPEELLEESIENSKKAIERAMKTIKEILITDRPNSISVAFGLKLDAEAGAVVARAGVEASLNITMTWIHTDKES